MFTGRRALSELGYVCACMHGYSGLQHGDLQVRMSDRIHRMRQYLLQFGAGVHARGVLSEPDNL
jgi:hypothetical protein